MKEFPWKVTGIVVVVVCALASVSYWWFTRSQDFETCWKNTLKTKEELKDYAPKLNKCLQDNKEALKDINMRKVLNETLASLVSELKDNVVLMVDGAVVVDIPALSDWSNAQISFTVSCSHIYRIWAVSDCETSDCPSLDLSYERFGCLSTTSFIGRKAVTKTLFAAGLSTKDLQFLNSRMKNEIRKFTSIFVNGKEQFSTKDLIENQPFVLEVKSADYKLKMNSDLKKLKNLELVPIKKNELFEYKIVCNEIIELLGTTQDADNGHFCYLKSQGYDFDQCTLEKDTQIQIIRAYFYQPLPIETIGMLPLKQGKLPDEFLGFLKIKKGNKLFLLEVERLLTKSVFFYCEGIDELISTCKTNDYFIAHFYQRIQNYPVSKNNENRYWKSLLESKILREKSLSLYIQKLFKTDADKKTLVPEMIKYLLKGFTPGCSCFKNEDYNECIKDKILSCGPTDGVEVFTHKPESQEFTIKLYRAIK